MNAEKHKEFVSIQKKIDRQFREHPDHDLVALALMVVSMKTWLWRSRYKSAEELDFKRSEFLETSQAIYQIVEDYIGKCRDLENIH